MLVSSPKESDGINSQGDDIWRWRLEKVKNQVMRAVPLLKYFDFSVLSPFDLG